MQLKAVYFIQQTVYIYNSKANIMRETEFYLYFGLFWPDYVGYKLSNMFLSAQFFEI